MKTLPLAAFLILFLPLAGASYTDVREYEWWILQSTVTTGAIAAAPITVPTNPYTHARASQQSVWEISATYTAPAIAGGGTQTFAFQVDGVAITGCTWSITRGAVALGLVVTTESNFLIRCLHPGTLTSGAHTITIAVGGTALTTAARTDIILRQTDTITDATLDPLMAQHSYTNALVNNTRAHLSFQDALFNLTTSNHEAIDLAKHAYQNNLHNETHDHIDSHFSYTNALINATSIGLNVTLADLVVRIDRNVTFLNMSASNVGLFGMSNLPGMTGPDSTLFLILFALFIWASLKGWWFVGFSAGISALKTAMDAFNPGLPPDLPLIAIVFLLFIGFYLEIAVHNYRRHQAAKAQSAALAAEADPNLNPRPF